MEKILRLKPISFKFSEEINVEQMNIIWFKNYRVNKLLARLIDNNTTNNELLIGVSTTDALALLPQTLYMGFLDSC